MPTAGASTSTSVVATPSSTAAPVSNGIVLPELPTVDAGVATSEVIVAGSYDWDTVVGDLQPATQGSAGLSVEFTGCHLRAPGQWVLSGSTRFSEGTGGADVVAAIERTVGGDMVEEYPFRFSLTGTGDFAIVVDGIAVQRERNSADRPVLRPLLYDECTIRVTHASVPVAARSVTLEATRRSDPLEWQAPPQTVQGLGSGVVLSDVNDPRIPWAYLTWSKQQFGLETLWLPDLPEVTLTDLAWNDNSPCISAGASIAPEDGDPTYYVHHERDCLPRSWIPAGDRTASSVRGFELAENEIGERVLRAELDGTVVTVGGEDATIEELESVAGSLVPFTNLYYQAQDAPGTDDGLDQAIAEALAPTGAVERGRFAVGDGYVVIATEDTVDGAMSSSTTVRPSNGRWIAQSWGGGGGGDLCLLVDGGGITQGDELVSWASWIAVIGAEKTWTIQVKDNGDWRDLPTTDGVYFEGSTTEPVGWADQPYRAIDEDGRPVRCSIQIPEPGAEWSPWQPPTARTDLPLEVDVATGLDTGDVVTVTGSGFYPDSSVTLSVCRFETTRWSDAWDCAINAEYSDEAFLASYAPVDGDGAFEKEFEVTATFDTSLGDAVDCHVERCVIRADGDRSYHQAGWVEVEFTAP